VEEETAKDKVTVACYDGDELHYRTEPTTRAAAERLVASLGVKEIAGICTRKHTIEKVTG
jgi:hypothetical protein